MSTATAPIAVTPNPTYQCQVCEDHRLRSVFYDYRPHMGAPANGRVVRLYCEHSDRGWRFIEILQGGSWIMSGTPEELTGTRLAGLRARFDHEQGVIKQSALSA